MRLADRKIKTGLELVREGRSAGSIIAKIEKNVREMVLEKFGYILSPFEIKQITRRETERGEKREGSLSRSQWNILRSKERAKLMQKTRQDIQQGKLFKKHKKTPPKEKKVNLKNTHVTY